VSGTPKLPSFSSLTKLPALLKIVLAWLGWVLALIEWLSNHPPPT